MCYHRTVRKCQKEERDERDRAQNRSNALARPLSTMDDDGSPRRHRWTCGGRGMTLGLSLPSIGCPDVLGARVGEGRID